MSDESQPGEPPRPLLRSRRAISPIWAIPIVAVLVALWLAYKANSDTGQTIQITFLTGEGLDAGKTRIKHNNVELGIVDKVEPTADLKTVVVTATMKKLADRYLDGAQFWVVRPRISFSSLSGLETLLSDKYIEMDPGDGKAGGVGEPSVWCRYSGLCAPIKAFTGLEEPPAVRAGVPGTEIFLDAEQLGSIVPAAPVYFHGEVVGEVLNTNFNTGKIELKAQINAPLRQGGAATRARASGMRPASPSMPACRASRSRWNRCRHCSPAGSPSTRHASDDLRPAAARRALSALSQPTRRDRGGLCPKSFMSRSSSSSMELGPRARGRRAGRVPRHPYRQRYPHPSAIRPRPGPRAHPGDGHLRAAAGRARRPRAERAVRSPRT